jgi:hypothetical protein
MVYQFVLNQLSSDEKIECEIALPIGALYATNKRVIRFDQGRLSFGSGWFQDLDYKHIVSIKIREQGYFWLLFIVLLILIGVAILYFFKAPDGLIYFLIFLAIILVILSFLRTTFIEFYAPSIKIEDWRIPALTQFVFRHPKELGHFGEFIQTIRMHCFFNIHSPTV